MQTPKKFWKIGLYFKKNPLKWVPFPVKMTLKHGWGFRCESSCRFLSNPNLSTPLGSPRTQTSYKTKHNHLYVDAAVLTSIQLYLQYQNTHHKFEFQHQYKCELVHTKRTYCQTGPCGKVQPSSICPCQQKKEKKKRPTFGLGISDVF